MAVKRQHAKAKRNRIPRQVVLEVLTEAGYRCGVPTCRGILAIDLHHLAPIRHGGPNTTANLLALCPTCHALFERGTISQKSLSVWKSFLHSLTNAYDHAAIDLLLFLKKTPNFMCSGDGVVAFARLVGSGLAQLDVSTQGFSALVGVKLSPEGVKLIKSWESADRFYLMDPRVGK